jgi:hypothetical protein
MAIINPWARLHKFSSSSERVASAAGPVVTKVDTSLLGRRVIIDIAYANLSH